MGIARFSSYVEVYPDQFITFTMPGREELYTDNRLFPFYKGLTPEGWLLEVAFKT